jgi:uncharacterized protein DUF6438
MRAFSSGAFRAHLTLLVAAWATTARADSTVPQPGAGKPMASLQRTACYGTCPIYKVTVFSDGTLKYEGERFVKKIGAATAKLSPAEVEALARAFQQADFFALADKYEKYEMTDAPSAITSFDDGKKQKTVSHYHGDRSAPAALRTLEDRIDAIVHIERFIGTPDERRKIPRR